MPRGRRPYTDTPTRVTIYLPESVISRVDTLLEDPVRDKRVYGGRSRLIARAVAHWLDLVESGEVSIDFHLLYGSRTEERL